MNYIDNSAAYALGPSVAKLNPHSGASAKNAVKSTFALKSWISPQKPCNLQFGPGGEHVAEIADASSMRSEVTHVLGFSKVYSDAFKISTDRISEFDFLCILLRSSATDLKVKKLRANSEIKKLLGVPDKKDARHKLNALVNDFKNGDGPFLKIVHEERYEDRYYSFNSNFDKAVLEYLSDFKKKVIPDWKLPTSLTPERARALFREIVDFIKTKHGDAWKKALNSIAALAPQGERKAWVAKVLHNSTYWVVILAAWKHRLGDRSTLIDDEGLKNEVYTTIGRPAGSVESVLRDLCAKGILEEAPDGGIYTLNGQLEPVMMSYTETLKTLRLELPKHLTNLESQA